MAEEHPMAGAVGSVETSVPRRRRIPIPVERAAVVGMVLVLGLGALCGWLGYRVYREHRADQSRSLYLEVGKQGAVNLTTIDYTRAGADVQRILDSATGAFREEFAGRSEALVNVVEQAQSKSSGTVTAAGVESMTADEARVLVALSVATTNLGAPAQQPPRYWRMRVTVSKVDDGAKISKVDFVP